jgi:large conductance mechanosensitive channel
MKKFFEEFKAFAMRGNVLDMAVGVVIGGAFGKIVTSLGKITNSVVNDIIMPLISMLTGGIDFSAWKWVLKEAVMEGSKVVTPEVAVNYGNLIAVILDFIIIAFAVFCMVKAVNKMHDKLSKPAEPESEKAPEPTKEELLLAEIRDLLKEQSK